MILYFSYKYFYIQSRSKYEIRKKMSEGWAKRREEKLKLFAQ
jgi:hypothetical protein